MLHFHIIIAQIGGRKYFSHQKTEGREWTSEVCAKRELTIYLCTILSLSHPHVTTYTE